MLIGILEGVAEATAGLSKGYFGRWSDASGKRVPFVQLGYALSSLSRPMMAVLVYPLWIFSASTSTVLVKPSVPGGTRCRALSRSHACCQRRGVQFSSQHGYAGAVFGPSLTLFISIFTKRLQDAFLSAIGESAGSLHRSFERKRPGTCRGCESCSLFPFWACWKQSPVACRQVVMGLLVFALFNSSDDVFAASASNRPQR
ncbi:MAG: hypothetical protein IPH78_15095 [Bacteroidetes bacterium]|nr:hypothetical protein [Bacteroidota bacterium]